MAGSNEGDGKLELCLLAEIVSLQHKYIMLYFQRELSFVWSFHTQQLTVDVPSLSLQRLTKSF